MHIALCVHVTFLKQQPQSNVPNFELYDTAKRESFAL